MKDVKQPRALETREKILQAAARLFALKGYHDTKLEVVLDTAQVTKGAFFHHFRDREDLGFAVLDWHMDRRRQLRCGDRVSPHGEGPLRSGSGAACVADGMERRRHSEKDGPGRCASSGTRRVVGKTVEEMSHTVPSHKWQVTSLESQVTSRESQVASRR